MEQCPGSPDNKDAKWKSSRTGDPTVQQERPLVRLDYQSTARLLQEMEPVRVNELCADSNAIFFGETHNNSEIGRFLADQVVALKESGVTSFGLELNPSEQPILDQINAGDMSQVKLIDWALKITDPKVQSAKVEMVKTLVQNGIKLYAFAPWISEPNYPDDPPEIVNMRQFQGAKIILDRVGEGKTAVLIGCAHAEYGSPTGQYNIKTANLVSAQGPKIKRVVFTGGAPFRYVNDQDPRNFINRVLVNETFEDDDLATGDFYLDTSKEGIKFLDFDGIIVLKEPEPENE